MVDHAEYKKCVYELYAVCNHIGSDMGSGHYTAHCKNSVNKKWYNYDDTMVKEISEDAIITPNAYILFYKAIKS
jgi:ubiquitin C-terminal hydrolase